MLNYSRRQCKANNHRITYIKIKYEDRTMKLREHIRTLKSTVKEFKGGVKLLRYLETSKAQGSNRSAQPFNALRALLVYPVFDGESQIGQTKNRSSEKGPNDQYNRDKLRLRAINNYT